MTGWQVCGPGRTTTWSSPLLLPSAGAHRHHCPPPRSAGRGDRIASRRPAPRSADARGKIGGHRDRPATPRVPALKHFMNAPVGSRPAQSCLKPSGACISTPRPASWKPMSAGLSQDRQALRQGLSHHLARGRLRVSTMTAPRRLSWSMRFALMISGVFAGAAVLAGAIAYVLLSEELTGRLRQDVESMAGNLAYTLRTAALRTCWNRSTRFPPTRGTGPPWPPTSVLKATNRWQLQSGPSICRAPRASASAATWPWPKCQCVVPTTYFAYGLQTNHGWIITGRDAEWVAENTRSPAAGDGLGPWRCIDPVNRAGRLHRAAKRDPDRTL